MSDAAAAEAAGASPRRIALLARYDLRGALTGAKGLVYLVPFAFFWTWLLQRLYYDGLGHWLQSSRGIAFAAYWLGTETARWMFRLAPPSLSAFFVAALAVAPLFAMLGACDQLASDLGRGYLRFLVPRCGRLEIYLARLLSACCLISGATLVAGLLAMAVAGLVDGRAPGEILAYGLRVNLVLLLYNLPFIAIMSLVSAAVASAPAALLSGTGGYALVLALVYLVTARWPEAAAVRYLLPGALKDLLLAEDVRWSVVAALALLLYAALFAIAGWHVFRRRDI